MVECVRCLVRASLTVRVMSVSGHGSQGRELEAEDKDVSRVWERLVKRGVVGVVRAQEFEVGSADIISEFVGFLLSSHSYVGAKISGINMN